MVDQRIEHEISHGRHLKSLWSGMFWYWETPAGKLRWRRRVKMLTSHIASQMKVLEVGCGVGYFTEEIAKTNASLVGIDISPDLLEAARSRIKAPHVTLKVENAYAMSFAENTFDTIVGSSVLHHLDVDKALREFFRVLRPGGEIYFTEPNMLNPQIFLERHTALFGYLIQKSPDETAFIRWSLEQQLLRHGFCDVRIVPFDFLHPLTPRFMIPLISATGACLERIPLVNEIAGSLYIKASKPADPVSAGNHSR